VRWLPLLLLVPLFGCAHADPLQSFAKAGVAYSASLDKALTAAETSAIDASSWRLLADDELANVTLAALDAVNAQDRARREQLDRLRTHSGLLARYLKAIAGLTSSDLPKEASKRIESIWTSAAGVGEALLGSSVLPPASGFTRPLEQIIDKAMHKRVKEHLADRAEALHAEFILQEAVLASLSRAVAHERELARQAAMQHAVVSPILAEEPIEDREAWAAERRRWLLADGEPRELTNARKSARALRVAFEALVGGTLDAAAAERLEAELRSPGLLAGLEVEE
jgi:hypothetical protein